MKTNNQRRKFITSTAALGLGVICPRAFPQPEQNVISIAAKKFEYSPSVIHLKIGVTVVLEFTSPETVMGFNAPEFKTRTDIIPGIKTRVTITPTKAGEYPFYCDIFCGAGHEDMTGVLVVA